MIVCATSLAILSAKCQIAKFSRQELAGGRSSAVGGGGGCGSWRGEGGGLELEAQLHQHSQDIAEMRAILEFQVGHCRDAGSTGVPGRTL